MGVGGQRHARYPLYRRLSGPQGRSGISATVLELLHAVNGLTEMTKVPGVFLQFPLQSAKNESILLVSKVN